jgi:hypothetical protein
MVTLQLEREKERQTETERKGEWGCGGALLCRKRLANKHRRIYGIRK